MNSARSYAPKWPGFTVCQLGLDHIGGYAVDALNHQRARHCSEPVGAHFVGSQTHAPKGCIDGVVAQGVRRAQAGEHIAAMSREGLQVFQMAMACGARGTKCGLPLIFAPVAASCPAMGLSAGLCQKSIHAHSILPDIAGR